MSRLAIDLKVVADYSSEDEEREAVAHKIRSTAHRKAQERNKKKETKDQRDKKSSHRQVRNEETSSDENVSRKHNKRSRKHRDNIDTEDTYERTAQSEKYADSNDYNQRHNKREVEKCRNQNRDDDTDRSKRDERGYAQERIKSYGHYTSGRREMEQNKHKQNDDNTRRKQEKSRYYSEDGDSNNYHRRDINRLEEYANSESNRRKNYSREERIETLRDRRQDYESENDCQRSRRRQTQDYESENDYQRRRSRQTQKSHYWKDDNDITARRSHRPDTQSEDSTDCDRWDSQHLKGKGCRSGSDECDYDRKDKKRQHADKSNNAIVGDESYSSRRRHQQHLQRERDLSSDNSDLDKHNQPKDKYQDDRSNKDTRKCKKSAQKSSRYQHDNSAHSNTSEKEASEKSKHEYSDDGIRTDYAKKGLQEISHQQSSENHYDREQIEKRTHQKDKERGYNKQKENRKSVQGSKSHHNSESCDMNDGTKSRQDRCRWDSSEDERDNRRKLQKWQESSEDEYDKQDNTEKHSFVGKANSQKNSKKDLRNDNRHEYRKSNHKEKSSEVQSREELTRNDSRNNERKDKNNEPELENRTPKGNENSESEKKDFNDGTKRKQNVDDILTRTGGAYIPPARLRAMQAKITDKSSISYQRIAWEALKKSINGLINKVNVSNLKIIINELFKENIVRAKGILARSIMQAQAASPTFTHVYAALVAIINTKFPHIGELIIKRLIIQFRRSFRRNDKQVCIACTNFIAHLVNQQTAHEVLALEILTLLLENPTDDSVELAVGFLKECGARLSDATRRGTDAIFERLRTILHDGEVDKRVQYMIEVMFAVRKDKFKDHPTVIEELDLVEEEDQFTHLITLEDAINPEDTLNVFKFDPEFEANEGKYEEIRKALLESSDSGEDNSDDDSNNENEEDEDNENETQTIIDNTETNLTSLRRTIYLTIQSSLDFEECAHKLLKLELKPGQIVELCYMILDCCAQQRTYEKFFGLLAQRFCQINKIYVEPFEEIFKTAYDTIHRFETNKLRNVARFFAHLFYTDAVSWQILSHIKLNEDETTSSSRIFVKILFQELCEYLGLLKLNERVKDPTMQEAFEGLFPRDSPRNTRFAINFFTSIGLGGLTDELREHLKNTPKTNAFQSATNLAVAVNNDNPDLSSEEPRTVEDSPSTDVSSSEDEPKTKKSRRTKKKKKKRDEKESKKRRKK